MPGLALSTPSTPSTTAFAVNKRPLCESPIPFPSAPAFYPARPAYLFWIATYADLPPDLQAFLADNGIHDFTPESYDKEDVEAARVYLGEELYSNVRRALDATQGYPEEEVHFMLQQILDAHMRRFDALLCCEVVVREDLGELVAADWVEDTRQREMDIRINVMREAVANLDNDQDLKCAL
ncbi:uncharacterized protein SCHCODRAFT_02661512 [Schizophyllum commune H4-8]|uniref:Uncharacterized protein n=1 Tax=Schizophyllum commune (strain H4-8 / FGSC 9210) TaxID=578458 RepID=D8PWI0_SCHCM|nr:uncharacterized protein SCHCODRAFT_02661512 [Schizophyllum commune H4-8]KAI5899942.1 hypothetical protein SCHCODRAFT_02661512 [Schizophyllum commune H4-8]